MADLSEGPAKIRLLEAHVLENESSKISYIVSTYIFGDSTPTYAVLALLPESGLKRGETASDFELAKSTEEALLYALPHSTSKLFWIEEICIHQDDDTDLRQQRPLVMPIHFKAEQVIIWAGLSTSSDFMDYYLGSNSEALVEEGFGFAQLLATVPVEDVIPIIRNTCLEGESLSWYHFIRILYRPWFRETNLLRTNYVDNLSQAIVLCGNLSIPWSQLILAAKRLRAAKPSPTFLLHAKTREDGKFEADKTSLMEADGSWFAAQIRFGAHAPHLLGRVIWQTKQSSSEAMKNRFLALLGYVADEYHVSEAHYSIKCFVDSLDEIGEETTSLKELESPAEPPSLPFDGVLYSYLRPEERSPFVHEVVNRRTTVTLIKLLPHHGNQSSPIQCGVLNARIENLPPFAFVLNAALRSSKFSTHILVNGQSFCIPKILELFLRCVRQDKEERILFVWQLCMFENQVKINDRKELEHYIIAKSFMAHHGANALDMYDLLDNSAACMEKQVPAGKSWESWLLELNS